MFLCDAQKFFCKIRLEGHVVITNKKIFGMFFLRKAVFHSVYPLVPHSFVCVDILFIAEFVFRRSISVWLDYVNMLRPY